MKQNASAVVAKVAQGTVVTITLRGRPVAQMIPLTATPMEALTMAGQVRPSSRRLSDLPPAAPIREGRRALSKVLEEMREDERY